MSDIIKAIVKTQLEIKPPVKDKINPRFKTRYSSIDSIYESIRIPMASNGLTISHSVPHGENRLVTTISHISGESISNSVPLIPDNQTSQGIASALTYARRYGICSLLGLPSDEDDDGESAQGEQEKKVTTTVPLNGNQKKMRVPTEKQIERLHYRGEANQGIRDSIFKYHKINSFYDLSGKEIEEEALQRMMQALG